MTTNNDELRKREGGLKGLVAGAAIGLVLILPTSCVVQWINGSKPSEHPIKTLGPTILNCLAGYALGRRNYQNATPRDYHKSMILID